MGFHEPGCTRGREAERASRFEQCSVNAVLTLQRSAAPPRVDECLQSRVNRLDNARHGQPAHGPRRQASRADPDYCDGIQGVKTFRGDGASAGIHLYVHPSSAELSDNQLKLLWQPRPATISLELQDSPILMHCIRAVADKTAPPAYGASRTPQQSRPLLILPFLATVYSAVSTARACCLLHLSLIESSGSNATREIWAGAIIKFSPLRGPRARQAPSAVARRRSAVSDSRQKN